MKTTAKDFALFKAEFLRWQNRLGLTHYRAVFRHVQIQDCFANITINHPGKIATVRLTVDLEADDAAAFDPVRSGRHEALHLLLGRLAWLGQNRFSVYSGDLDEEEESIVRRLENLLNEDQP